MKQITYSIKIRNCTVCEEKLLGNNISFNGPKKVTTNCVLVEIILKHQPISSAKVAKESQMMAYYINTICTNNVISNLKEHCDD